MITAAGSFPFLRRSTPRMKALTRDCGAPRTRNANGRYDLVVVGVGSAGFSAAITAVDEGAQVALVGDGTIRGTSVNIGCVPSKTLIRATEAVHRANIACQRFAGVDGHGRITNWSRVAAQKDALVSGLRQAKYADLLPEIQQRHLP